MVQQALNLQTRQSAGQGSFVQVLITHYDQQTLEIAELAWTPLDLLQTAAVTKACIHSSHQHVLYTVSLQPCLWRQSACCACDD